MLYYQNEEKRRKQEGNHTIGLQYQSKHATRVTTLQLKQEEGLKFDQYSIVIHELEPAYGDQTACDGNYRKADWGCLALFHTQ